MLLGCKSRDIVVEIEKNGSKGSKARLTFPAPLHWQSYYHIVHKYKFRGYSLKKKIHYFKRCHLLFLSSNKGYKL